MVLTAKSKVTINKALVKLQQNLFTGGIGKKVNRNKLTSRLSADVHAGVAGAGDGGPAQAVLAGHLGLDVWKK